MFKVDDYNVTVDEFEDKPASFGPPFPERGLWVGIVLFKKHVQLLKIKVDFEKALKLGFCFDNN